MQVEHPQNVGMSMIPAGSVKAATGPNLNIVCKSCSRRRSEHAGAGGSSFVQIVFLLRSVRLHKWQHGTLISWDNTLHGGGVARRSQKYEENVKS
jgi:hypothetical protein